MEAWLAVVKVVGLTITCPFKLIEEAFSIRRVKGTLLDSTPLRDVLYKFMIKTQLAH